jgi:hypothetical protein
VGDKETFHFSPTKVDFLLLPTVRDVTPYLFYTAHWVLRQSYGLNDLRIAVSIPDRDFSLCRSVHTVSEGPSSPLFNGCGGSFPGDKEGEVHTRSVLKLRMDGARPRLLHTVHGVVLNYEQGQLYHRSNYLCYNRRHNKVGQQLSLHSVEQ